MPLIAIRHPSSQALKGQTGLSLIELMVGITVGMIVVAGASLLMTQQLSEHRRLVLETQIQQDLRAAADLMLRELRRGGAHKDAERFVWGPGATVPAPIANAYAPQTALASNQITYSYSKAPDGSSENNLSDSDERFGFRLNNQTLQFQISSGNWQPLTDPATLLITGFTVQQVGQNLPLQNSCEQCTPGSTTCPPVLQIKRFDITLSGKAAHDDAVVRSISVSGRMRNDQVIGTCP